MSEETAVLDRQAIDGADAATPDTDERRNRSQSYWGMVRREYRKNRLAVWSFYFILFLVAVAVLADFLANDRPIACSYKGNFHMPVVEEYLVGLGVATVSDDFRSVTEWKELEYDWAFWPPVRYAAASTDIMASFTPPFEAGSDHYLGTDQTGRDLLAGLIHGTRISLTIGIVAQGIAVLIGVLLGALAGYYLGWVDIVISRIIEVFLNFPTLFLILAIVAFFGADIFLVMVVIGITGWMGIARFVRGEVLKVRSLEYVAAARVLGFPADRVIFRHILPNALAPVLVAVAFGIASAILIESSLSFLGFGVPLEVVTWGSTLSQAQRATFAWWLAVFPGIMIFLTVASYNIIGDGLRDATDPKLRH